MPIYEYICEDKHLTEIWCVTYESSPVECECEVCSKKATKTVSRSASLFQPWAFANSGYSSLSDRRGFFNDDNREGLGEAHKKAMKEQPNRSYTRYRGGNVKTIKTI